MLDFLEVYPWALPVVIFLGRMLDVPLSTLRIIFVARGEKKIAPLIGFVEVFIWVIIISQVISRANSLTSYLAFAGGYAAGTYLGLYIESWIGFGFIKYRIFTTLNGRALVTALNQNGFGSTLVHGEGAVEAIDIVETVVGRKSGPKVEQLISEFDSKAFTLIEDIRSKQLGIFTKQMPLLPARHSK